MQKFSQCGGWKYYENLTNLLNRIGEDIFFGRFCMTMYMYYEIKNILFIKFYISKLKKHHEAIIYSMKQ